MRKSSTNFLPYIASIGGLLSYELLYNLRAEHPKNDYTEHETFNALDGSHPLSKREFEAQITDAWNFLLERWDSISLRYEKMDLSESRTKWIIPFLEALGFDPQYNKQNVIVGEDDKLSFRISHKGFNDSNAPYINCVGPDQKLDEPESEGSENKRRRARSPHDELQSLLNVPKPCRWGIVTNGIGLRVLRQFFHTTTKAYVEFDLENIFRSRSFSDFRLVYRVAHVSRFLLFDKKSSDDKITQTCILEEFHEQSRLAGVSAGEDLRKNVKIAIESLANGFLTQELVRKMVEDENLCKSYYAEILRVIYRMIFLLFAEQRQMLPTSGLYAEEYSMNRLREIAFETRGQDDHTDLWEGLKTTFKLLKQGCTDSRIVVFAYNGTLFEELQTPILSNLSCKNSDLCNAVQNLTSIERGNISNRINYLDLGVEEIGSIYESLLDYTPRIATFKQEVDGRTVFPNTFYLDPRGASRRSTGSYYTDPRLIDELIHSALEPVLKARLADSERKETVLLSLRVCDPACGSGAFLIAANNFLARQLAKIRTEQIEPSEQEVRRARRDVLQHCIYGVDVNPMAVELAKVSLWINAALENLPLNFLDHHIKCGNSLIGTTFDHIEKGIPAGAYKPIAKDDREIAKEMGRLNKSFGEFARLEDFIIEIKPTWRSQFEELANLSEGEVIDVEEKRKRYSGLLSSEEYTKKKFIADTWVSTFFWKFVQGFPDPPLSSNIHSIQKNGITVAEREQAQHVKELSEKHRFFHWQLEFPEVFAPDRSGFDCLIGNPPWDKIKVEEREWFRGRDQVIAECESKTQRARMIEELARKDPSLYSQWLEAQYYSQKLANFVKSSGLYKLTGVGDSNTYALFAEHSIFMINPGGRIGLVVKTGIATDDTWKDFFGHLVNNGTLCSLYDFQNTELLFKDVAPVERFCLLTVSGPDFKQSATEFAFLLTNPDQLDNDKHKIKLETEAIKLINPNTKTLPSFQSQKDAEIVKMIHQRWPILIHEGTNANPWNIEYARVIDMTIDARFFQDNIKEKLEKDGFSLKSDGLFIRENERYLPLIEAKFFNQYDHRFATFEDIGEAERLRRRAGTNYPSEDQKKNFDFEILPRYWMAERDFTALTKHYSWNHEWVFAFRNVTRMTTDTRSCMATIIPWNPIGNSAPVLFFRGKEPLKTALLFTGVFTSIVFDYVLRQKIGGTNFNAFILKQLPAPPPEEFKGISIETDQGKEVASDYITSRVLRLVWTSHSLDCLGLELRNDEGPFVWNSVERRRMRTEIDAAVSKIYGIKKDDLAHMCETFRIQKDKDMQSFGRFRTMDDLLGTFDNLIVRPVEEVAVA